MAQVLSPLSYAFTAGAFFNLKEALNPSPRLTISWVASACWVVVVASSEDDNLLDVWVLLRAGLHDGQVVASIKMHWTERNENSNPSGSKYDVYTFSTLTVKQKSPFLANGNQS